MLRPAVVASFSSVAAVVLFMAPAAAADPVPGPPPGSVNVQPAGLSTDGQGQPAAYHCGVAANAAGSGYSAQPQQVSSSGASSPTGCSSGAPSGGGSTQASSSGQNTAPGRAAQTQSAAANTNGGEAVPAISVHSGGGFVGGPLWIGLLLLLALFVLLIGFALGRRRPARVVA